MCGIAGFYGAGDREILAAMTRAINYRGPDDEGFFLDGHIGLGHRRLSILDLSAAGHQPMTNEDKTVWIAFNGEIYNFQEAKTRLKQPHKFLSSTDTEVIVHLYEEYGAKAFEYLNGMFAIALYDAKTRTLLLARDRLGKKPLYYGLFGNTLIFGSELKAMLKHPACRRELDWESVNKYFLYEYVPTPHTIFRNIKKLEAGSVLTFDGLRISSYLFWDVPVPEGGEYNRVKNLSEITVELDQRINEAVRMRLVSDAPLGVFLSGGIDSSAIAYYAQRNASEKIKTFSIGFTESSFDESAYARKVAEFLGTEHHEKILNPADAGDLVPHIAALVDEPLADASLIPTFLLSQFTSETVTVALGGDGGDELFAGYDPFRAERFARIYEKIPHAIRARIIEPMIKNLPVSFNNISLDFKAKKFIGGFGGDGIYRHQRWLGSFDYADRERLFAPDIWSKLKTKNEFEDIDGYAARFPRAAYEDQILYLYLRTYLMDDIMVKVDRASMYNSLETRAPLLDYKLVEYVARLPYSLKIHGGTTKYIFKKLMEDKLPREIVYRKKKGFGMPVAEWLNGALRPLCDELFAPEFIKEQGFFNAEYIGTLLSAHRNHRADNRKPLWTLLMFQLWYRNWYT